MKEKPHKSALNVMEGIEQPGQINEDMVRKMKVRRSGSHEAGYYVNGIIKGNRTILSQAITMIESSLPKHQEKAQEIIAECLRVRQLAVGNSASTSRIPHPISSIHHPSSTIRIGITGIPGVGKSTFIEALGK